MKRITLYSFAPTFVTALASVAILGYAHFSAVGQAKRIHKVNDSTGVTNIVAAENGSYVVRYSDDRIVKYAPGGSRLWEIPFMRLPDREPMQVAGIAVDPLGDVLVLGVTKTFMMTLYRVSGDRKATVSLVGQYPGLDPAKVAVAPDGSVYLTAFHRDTLLQSIAERSRLPEEYIEQPFHELDSQGRLVRSLGTMRLKPKSVQDLGDFLIRSVERRLVFAPDGRAFLVDSVAFELEELDLDSGELTGQRIRLASGAPAEQASLDDLQFLDSSSVLYTVSLLKDARIDRLGRLTLATPVGWEVRIADLEAGTSLRVSSGKSPVTGRALFFPDLDRVAFLETFTRQTVDRWSRTNLADRLARLR